MSVRIEAGLRIAIALYQFWAIRDYAEEGLAWVERLLAHADFTGFYREFFVTTHFYAPLVHLITAVVFLVLGASRLTGVFVNLISLAILLWAVASISRDLFAGASR